MYIIQDSEDIENDNEDDLDKNDDLDEYDDDIDLSDDNIDEENISDVENKETSNFKKRKFKANIPIKINSFFLFKNYKCDFNFNIYLLI